MAFARVEEAEALSGSCSSDMQVVYLGESMRSEIETFLSQLDRRERRRVAKGKWMDALMTIDRKLPAEESIMALAFNLNIGEPGVLAVTSSRMLFVGESVQSWRVENIDKVTSDGKAYLGMKPQAEDPMSWHINNGPAFISSLNEMVNQRKFESF